MPRTWVQSIYRHMGYTRIDTSLPVPKGLYDECCRKYLQDVYDKIRQHDISPKRVLNADQTLSSFVSVGKSTMTARGGKSVPIKGLTDK